MAKSARESLTPSSNRKSPFDNTMFAKVPGLISWDELKRTYADNDWDKLTSDVTKGRLAEADAELKLLVARALEGGIYLRAKEMTPHNFKGDVAKDVFGKHDDTMSSQGNLYKNLPWGWDDLLVERKKRHDANARQMTLEETLVFVTKIAREKYGVGLTPPRFKAQAQVIIIDPATPAITRADLPNVFPGGKSVKPHWEKDSTNALIGGTEMWREVGGNITGYYTFELPRPEAEASKPPVVLREKGRILLMKVGKSKALMDVPMTVGGLEKLIDFNAREPKRQEGVSIDPATGEVKRIFVRDNEIVESDNNVLIPLTDFEFFDLKMWQSEVTSMYTFTLGEQRFRGRSLIVRAEPDSEWLAPLNLSMSAGDVRKRLTFPTLEAIVQANDGEVPENPNEGFEPLNPALTKTYFGVDQVSLNNILRDEPGLDNVWIGSSSADRRLVEAHFIRKGADGVDLFNIDKLREVVNRYKERLAAYEAAGFQEPGVDYFGAGNHTRYMALLELALNLKRSGVLDRLRADDLERVIGGRKVYHIDRMTKLVSQGRAKAELMIEAAKAAGFSALTRDDRIAIFKTANPEQDDVFKIFGKLVGEKYFSDVVNALVSRNYIRVLPLGMLWHLECIVALLAGAPLAEVEQPESEVKPAAEVKAEAEVEPAAEDKAESEVEPAAEVEGDPLPDYAAMSIAAKRALDKKLAQETFAAINYLVEALEHGGVPDEWLNGLHTIGTRLTSLVNHHDILLDEVARFYAEASPSQMTDAVLHVAETYSENAATAVETFVDTNDHALEKVFVTVGETVTEPVAPLTADDATKAAADTLGDFAVFLDAGPDKQTQPNVAQKKGKGKAKTKGSEQA